jgi:hypothetical protein
VDPYPEYWGTDWYQTDDVYVAYSGGGYYLYNRRYPGRPGVAIGISFQNYDRDRRFDLWRGRRARNWDSDHETWEERGGYDGAWIPDGYFGSHYGQHHWFRVSSLPFTVIDGFPCIQYGDYWVTFVDPIPEYWSDDWFETDDVYIDYYGDGYYLFNRRFPYRPGIAIRIMF